MKARKSFNRPDRRLALAAGWLLLLLSGCASQPGYYQVGTLAGLMAGDYAGRATIGTLPARGDTGLGTFDNLDGEMVVVDGVVHQVRADGGVLRPDPATRTPYAAVAFSRPDLTFDIHQPLSCAELEASIDEAIDSAVNDLGRGGGGDAVADGGPFYLLRIDGEFASVRTRSVPAQARPWPPLAEVVKQQSVFQIGPGRGTLVGFRAPPFAAGLAAVGHHLHFLNEARDAGGHVLDCRLTAGQVAVTRLRQLEIDL